MMAFRGPTGLSVRISSILANLGMCVKISNFFKILDYHMIRKGIKLVCQRWKIYRNWIILHKLICF